MEAAGVRWNVMPCAADTIVKLRVLSRNQQLLRMDFEETLVEYANDLFVGYAQQHLADADLVVFSDYAKGTLQFVQSMLSHCRELGNRLWWTPRDRILSAIGATLIAPNLSELEAVVGRCASEAEMIEKANDLRASLDIDAILVTRSEAGMTLIGGDKPAQHFSASAAKYST